jgi:hypothetical protein
MAFANILGEDSSDLEAMPIGLAAACSPKI